MQETDYIIVGFGLSGLAVTRQLQSHNKKVVVIDKPSQNASKVAGGMYNPVILKRFTLAWNANEQLPYALQFYKSIEDELKIKIINPLPVYRRFSSIEEQNNWFEASDKPLLNEYLNSELKTTLNKNVNGNYGFGEVKQTGTINTEKLINAFKSKLSRNTNFIEENFNYDSLQVNKDSIIYNNLIARGIIFCEGIGIKNNPYFNTLDIRGNKGEYLIIKAPQLNLEVAIKSGIFIIPLGDNNYKVGASYDRLDTTTNPTETKKIELKKQLDAILTTEYQIIDQVAGIRPTTKDRRPYIGSLNEHKNVYLCNGLGSRGVITSPTISKYLVDHILKDLPIPSDISLERHY